MADEPAERDTSLTRSKKGGQVHFDHPDHPEVADQITKAATGPTGRLETNQERFDRIERTIAKIATYAGPEAQKEILGELGWPTDDETEA